MFHSTYSDRTVKGVKPKLIFLPLVRDTTWCWFKPVQYDLGNKVCLKITYPRINNVKILLLFSCWRRHVGIGGRQDNGGVLTINPRGEGGGL